MQAETKDRASSAPAIGTPTAARPGARRHARRHRTCPTAVLKLRSTRQRACFITFPDVARTSVAGEVTLYLALPSPLFCRRPLLGPTTGPSSFRPRTRSVSAAGSPQCTIPVQKRAQRLHRKQQGMIAPPNSSRSAQRTRRGSADEPSRVPLRSLATALIRPSRRDGRLRLHSQRAARRSMDARTYGPSGPPLYLAVPDLVPDVSHSATPGGRLGLQVLPHLLSAATADEPSRHPRRSPAPEP